MLPTFLNAIFSYKLGVDGVLFVVTILLIGEKVKTGEQKLF